MTAPGVICAAVLLGCILLRAVRERHLHASMRELFSAATKDGSLKALPAVLIIFYLFFPTVSSLVFQALPSSCDEPFQSASGVEYSFLTADFEIDCNDLSAYSSVLTLAGIGFCLYTVGVPVLYGLLLRRVRHTLIAHRSTPLSEALTFLHRDYEPQYYYWEIVELGRKLFLVGFAAQIRKGSLLQIFVASCVCLVYFMFKQLLSPYKLIEDDYFAVAIESTLTVCFIFALLLKMNELTAAVVLSMEQTQKFQINLFGLGVGLLFCVLIGLALLALVSIQQVTAAARGTQLLPQATPVSVPCLTRARCERQCPSSGSNSRTRRRCSSCHSACTGTSSSHSAHASEHQNPSARPKTGAPVCVLATVSGAPDKTSARPSSDSSALCCRVRQPTSNHCCSKNQKTNYTCPTVADASIFLDVDDLKEIGALEQYVEESSVIMIFVSKGYFTSRSASRAASNPAEADQRMMPLTLSGPQMEQTACASCATPCRRGSRSRQCTIRCEAVPLLRPSRQMSAPLSFTPSTTST